MPFLPELDFPKDVNRQKRSERGCAALLFALDMIRAHVEKERGLGARSPPICQPWRNVAVVDEDTLLDMIRLHADRHLQTIEECGNY